MLNKFNLKMLLVYLGKLIWDLYLELALGFQEWGHRWDPSGERGGNIISEKLICFSVFQAEEKAGQPPGSKAPKEEGVQEVVEELSSSSFFFFQIKNETIEM